MPPAAECPVIPKSQIRSKVVKKPRPKTTSTKEPMETGIRPAAKTSTVKKSKPPKKKVPMDSDVDMSTDEEHPSSPRENRVTRSSSGARITPNPSDTAHASYDHKGAHPKSTAKSPRSSRTSSPESGLQADGSYKARGRDDDAPSTSWNTTSSRKRD